MPATPIPRIAVYGRHSSALQSTTSSSDQAASCSKLIEFLGGTVVGTYLDPELSGYRRNRPALQRLLQSMRDGEIDIVVCQSLDRLARDAEDIVWLAKEFDRYGIELHTISEGHPEAPDFAIPDDPYRSLVTHFVNCATRN